MLEREEAPVRYAMWNRCRFTRSTRKGPNDATCAVDAATGASCVPSPSWILGLGCFSKHASLRSCHGYFILILIIIRKSSRGLGFLADVSPTGIHVRGELPDTYSRFGWKWAVLAYMTARILTNGKPLPSDILQDLKTVRTRMESGCHTLCDIAADLRNLEIRFFSALLHVSQGEVHAMLELISKAMNGSIQEKDIDLSPLRPILVNCTIPQVCHR